MLSLSARLGRYALPIILDAEYFEGFRKGVLSACLVNGQNIGVVLMDTAINSVVNTSKASSPSHFRFSEASHRLYGIIWV